MSDQDWVEVDVSDFSDEGLGRAIVDFAESGDISKLIEVAKSRNIQRPNVEVPDEAKFYEFVAWVCSKVPSA